MHCNMYTTRWQINSFIQRALLDRHNLQYYVLDLDLLSLQNLNLFMKQIDFLLKLKVTDTVDDKKKPKESNKIQRPLVINKNMIIFVKNSSASEIVRQSGTI
jgi:hypothetical protein